MSMSDKLNDLKDQASDKLGGGKEKANEAIDEAQEKFLGDDKKDDKN